MIRIVSKSVRSSPASASLAVLTTLAALMLPATGQAQVFGPPLPVDSFEDPTGIGNVIIPGDTPNALYVSHAQSTVGVTDGAHSLAVEMFGGGSAFGGGGVAASATVQIDVTQTNNATGYASFAEAAAAVDDYLLEFDLTFAESAWDGTDFGDGGTHWSFPIIGLSYDDGAPGGGGATGFGTTTLGTNFWNVTGTNTVSIPLADLTGGIPLPANANYYGIQFGANQRFMSPGVDAGVVYNIDNVVLKPRPVVQPVTLFSWETPDDPGTTDVNEAFEGWVNTGLNPINPANSQNPLGDVYAHTHSVTEYSLTDLSQQTVFPTNGTHSLKIDTTSQDPLYVHPDNDTEFRQSYGFRWATNYFLDSTPDDGELVPEIQAKVTNLVRELNASSAIQFDVAFSDPLGGDPDGGGVFTGGSTAVLPNFLSIAMSIADGRGSFFQYDSPSFTEADMATMILERNPDGVDPDEPMTITFPFAGMIDKSEADLGSLASSPIPEDVESITISLALNFGNGPVIAHIDNFRVLQELSLTADFDRDGDVDADDLNDPVDGFRARYGNDLFGNDFLAWQAELGTDATPGVTGVPEPTSVALFAMAAIAGGALRRRL